MSPFACGCSTGRANPFHLTPCLPTAPDRRCCLCCICSRGRSLQRDVCPVGTRGQARGHVRCRTPGHHPTHNRAGHVPCRGGNAVLEGTGRRRPGHGPGNAQPLSQMRGSNQLMLMIYQPNKPIYQPAMCVVQEMGLHLQLLPTAASTVGTEPSS